MHQQHERPDHGAGVAGEGELRVEELERERAPGHDVQERLGESKDCGAEDCRAGERIGEDVRDRGDDPRRLEAFARREHGVHEQHPADERQRRIADQRIAAEEARQDVPE